MSEIIRALDLDVSKPGEYTIPDGIIKRVHVNQHNIRSNRNDGTNLPVFTCKTSHGNYKAHHVDFHGPSSLDQDRGQLPCGARVWVETEGAITIKWDPFE